MKCNVQALINITESVPTNEVSQLQGPHGLVRAQLHAAVDVLSAAHALRMSAARDMEAAEMTQGRRRTSPHN